MYMIAMVDEHTGVIREEARTRCGTEEDLKNAISRGAVKEVKHGNVMLYLFPNLKIGKHESYGTEQRAQRELAITDDAFDAWGSMVDEFGWSVTTFAPGAPGVADGAAGAPSAGSSNDHLAALPGIPSVKIPEKIETELLESDSKFAKMIKGVEKIVSDAEGQLGRPGTTAAFEEQLQRTELLLPQVTAAGTKLHFIAKYHKTLEGQKVTIEAAKACEP